MIKTEIKRMMLALFGLLFFVQCGDDQPEIIQIDPAFTAHISAFTSGMISNQRSIRIRLVESLDEKRREELKEVELFSFEPEIKGKTVFVDAHTLEFQPEELLPSAQLFKAELRLGKIKSVKKELENFVFQFQVLHQGIKVEFGGLNSINPQDLVWQELKGSLRTYDYAQAEVLEALFGAKQGDKSLKLSWEHQEDGKTHRFQVDSVERKSERSKILLFWEGEKIGAENGEEEVEIPSLGEFTLMHVEVKQHPDQHLVLYFSDPLDPKQNLEGLLHFEDNRRFTSVIEGSEIRVYPRSRLSGSTKIIIEKGIANAMGYKFPESVEHDLHFSSIKPNVALLGEGVIIPNSGGLNFPFKAVNLSAVKMRVIRVLEKNVLQFLQVNQLNQNKEMKRVGRIVYKGEVLLKGDKAIDLGIWNNFSVDLSKLIQAEPGAIYRVQIGFDQKHSLYQCEEAGESAEENFEYSEEEQDEGDYDYWDWSGYSEEGDYWDYHYREKDMPCKESYYKHHGKGESRNVLASNLGIIAKGGNGKSMHFIVNDIVSTEPLSGVELELYNYQQQLVGSGSTDGQGMVKIELKGVPFVAVASSGNQKGYLRLDDGSALSLSMFDVSGSTNKKGIKGFIYGERGVWRPGDSIHLNLMVEDKLKVLSPEHPILFELYDPQGSLFHKRVISSHQGFLYDLSCKTDPESPTGNWTARVRVGGSLFSKNLKIETVKPNRLKIKLDFPGEYLSSSEKNSYGTLQSQWMHGATARNLKAMVKVKLAKGQSSFKGFEGFHFSDPGKDFYSEEHTLFEGYTDNNGKASIKSDLYIDKGAPGMLKASFDVKVFEEGGEFSVDRFSMPYSPYRAYAGIKIPKGEGWRGSLYSNKRHQIPLACVGEDGKALEGRKLKVEVFKVRWRWWWESEGDNLSRYTGRYSSDMLHSSNLNTDSKGKAMYELNLGKDYYYWGRVMIRVTDSESGHSAAKIAYMDYPWDADAGRENPGGANMLSFTSDKEKYNVGEMVQLNIPSSGVGRALISLESGSEVLEKFWVECSEKNTQFSFKTDGRMAPNVFVHISLLQPHNQSKNDLPIRLYGVQPIEVLDPSTHLKPQIEMADELAPEKEVKITVKEENGRPMAYTLAVVDEGLLDLTRFKTPDPWKYFYSRDALGVKSWDMYDYVMGAFSGDMAALLELGGDEYLKKDGSKKANRFKPVVKHLGPFYLKAGQSAQHRFTMPNYIGSVRTMLVAREEGAYGFAQKSTPVRKPLMVLSTLPRVLGPEEYVDLPVTVFAMDEKIKNVKVEVESNDLLRIQGAKAQSLYFEQTGDKMAYFKLKTPRKLGVAKLKVKVSSGNIRATHEIELDVRMPNPVVSKVIDAVIEPGGNWKGSFSAIGLKGTNAASLELSKIPSMNLEGRLKYLIRYPHGCVEQTTSSVFPQLYLANLMDLPEEMKSEIQENVKSGINRLRTFQQTNGGLSYWPGYWDEPSEWGTNYAGHFMLEAKAMGYDLPAGYLDRWIKYQKERANSWTGRTTYANGRQVNRGAFVQAYRLYTLALAKKPQLGAMNRLRERGGLSQQTLWRLAAAYQLAGKPEIGEQLILNQETTVKAYRELSYTYGSGTRDEAMILETLTLMGKNAQAKKLMDIIAGELARDRWMSTQTTAYSLLAVSKFVGGDKAQSPLKFTLSLNNSPERTLQSGKPLAQEKLKIKEEGLNKISLVNKSETRLFVKVQLEGIPLRGDSTSDQNNLDMRVRYLNMDGQVIQPSSLEQGMDFMCEVRLYNPGLLGDYKEMALTQIFPSGWEIHNIRMMEGAATNTGDHPTYQDVRDDRVMTYFDLPKGSTRTYKILLNASYTGKYYLPSVYCEAMYDNDIYARKGGKWVAVKKAVSGK